MCNCENGYTRTRTHGRETGAGSQIYYCTCQEGWMQYLQTAYGWLAQALRTDDFRVRGLLLRRVAAFADELVTVDQPLATTLDMSIPLSHRRVRRNG